MSNTQPLDGIPDVLYCFGGFSVLLAIDFFQVRPNFLNNAAFQYRKKAKKKTTLKSVACHTNLEIL